MLKRIFAVVIVGLSFLVFTLVQPTPALSAAPASIQGLHVSGNTIRNSANQIVRILGVNHSGAEYSCVQNNGIFDSPVDAASVQAITTWKVNAVRVPLNEDCWLAINGVPAADAGTNYQNAIINYVNLLNNAGLIAILDLHWTAPGSTLATAQNPMPDTDHSPAFWTSVANTFKTNSSVIFDLFNEPFPDNNSDSAAAWSCWKNGGTCSQVSYQVAGMQTLVNTVRATGATNIVMLGGVQFSNALSQWLANKPTDSTGNLAASWHVYNFNVCSNTTCWNTNAAPVAAQVPLIAGEIGENDCAHGFIDGLMSWLDSHSANYLGWTWNAWDCSSGPSLISDYNGTATNFGIGFKNHIASLSGQPTNTPLPTNTPTRTPSFQPPTNTPMGPTATRTNTPVPPTATRTNTPGAPTATTVAGALTVRVESAGVDNTQQSQFNFLVANTGSSAQSNISVRIYFALDGSQAVSKYVFEKYWDQSGIATVSGPTLASGSVYYYTVSYGTTSLAAGSSWQFNTALHLSDWSSNFSGGNDAWHSGYAVGALPSSFTNTTHIPAFVGSSLVWGSTP